MLTQTSADKPLGEFDSKLEELLAELEKLEADMSHYNILCMLDVQFEAECERIWEANPSLTTLENELRLATLLIEVRKHVSASAGDMSHAEASQRLIEACRECELEMISEHRKRQALLLKRVTTEELKWLLEPCDGSDGEADY